MPPPLEAPPGIGGHNIPDTYPQEIDCPFCREPHPSFNNGDHGPQYLQRKICVWCPKKGYIAYQSGKKLVPVSKWALHIQIPLPKVLPPGVHSRRPLAPDPVNAPRVVQNRGHLPPPDPPSAPAFPLERAVDMARPLFAFDQLTKRFPDKDFRYIFNRVFHPVQWPGDLAFMTAHSQWLALDFDRQIALSMLKDTDTTTWHSVVRGIRDVQPVPVTNIRRVRPALASFPLKRAVDMCFALLTFDQLERALPAAPAPELYKRSFLGIEWPGDEVFVTVRSLWTSLPEDEREAWGMARQADPTPWEDFVRLVERRIQRGALEHDVPRVKHEEERPARPPPHQAGVKRERDGDDELHRSTKRRRESERVIEIPDDDVIDLT